ncbi:MAG: hypothetical protein EBU90_14040 [Proteobacteria bacterium]|nr:hypothetical protein [Pseudomonadota bacterium]
MNRRIAELAEQSGIYFYKQNVLDKHYPELYDGVYCELSVEQFEKFIELVVRDCAELCTNVVDYHAILNNFGFEHIPDFEDFGDN